MGESLGRLERGKNKSRIFDDNSEGK